MILYFDWCEILNSISDNPTVRKWLNNDWITIEKRPSAQEKGKGQTGKEAHVKFITTISIPISIIDLKIFILAFAISLAHKSITFFTSI